jgi:hypothetical protein
MNANNLILKQHASKFMLIFMKILKMYLKVKYCELNKEINLHISNGTCNPHKTPKKQNEVKECKKIALLVLVTQYFISFKSHITCTFLLES